ncbi:MAG: oligosaccharide flippase family protein [Acidobacteriia bacterium]|nr:oligosaccharide flippase family protein [Terriglobia bacterium]
MATAVQSVAVAGPAEGSLYSNISWTLAGNVVYAASQWLLLVALAKMGRPEQVGELALGLAITGPLFVASQLHLRGVQATDAVQEFPFSDYLGLRWISTALVIVIAAALAVTYRASLAMIIVAIGVARGFDNISDIYYGALQQQERMARMGKSMMLKGCLSVAGLIGAMTLTRSVAAVAASLALVSALTFLLYDRRSVAFGRPDRVAVTVEPFRWNLRGCWKLFRLALPLTIVLVLVSLNLNVPRYFVEHARGEAELGVFAALSYLIVAGNLVVNACGQATAPKLAKLYAEGSLRRFWGMLTILLGISAVCGLIGIVAVALAGERIVTLVYSAAYAPYASLLSGLMIAATLLYAGQFLGYGMTAARIFRAQVPLFILVLGATAAACALLIPRYGLQGAVTGMIAGFSVQCLGSAAILVRARPAHKE